MESSVRSLQKLRLNVMLLSLAVLVIALGFNVLLSFSALDTLATDLLLSGYQGCGERLVQSIERGLRFGKPLSSYAGMAEILAELRHGTEGIDRVAVVDAEGGILYSEPVAAAASLPAPGTLASGQKIDKIPGGFSIALPLQHHGVAGWVVMQVDGYRIAASTGAFLRWSCLLLAMACIGVGLILAARMGLLSRAGERPHIRLGSLGRLLLITIGGAQAAYSLGTLVLFDTFVTDAVRSKVEIMAQGVQRDFEYLIYKGVDVINLKGKDQVLEQIVASNGELAGAALNDPDGRTLALAGHLTGNAGLTVTKPLSTYWPSRFRQRQEIMSLQIAIDPDIIRARLGRLALDLATSLAISFLLLLELAKLLGLIARRSLLSAAGPGSAAERAGTAHSFTTPALRAAGFVFFLGYDMGISFIPLLARQLYQPFWGVSEGVGIGLPISAEMVSAGIALLLSGNFSERYGWRPVFVLGTVAAALGLLLGGLSTTLSMLILSRVVAGFGFGMVLMASQIGTLGQSDAGSGITSVFAGIFSGSICGSAAGALLADHLHYGAVLVVGTGVILFAVLAVAQGRALPVRADGAMSQDAAGAGPRIERASMFAGGMGLLTDPRMHIVLLLVGIPAAVCLTGFLHYLLPLRLAGASVEQSDIGRIFMLYGLCFITAGPPLGKWIDRRADKSLFLTLTGVLSGAALLLAAAEDALGLFGTAAAVVALGLAQCIAAPASMLCVLTLASAQKLGREKSASIYRGLERIGQVAGPVVFGSAVLVLSPAQALMLMGSAILVLAVLFQLLWRLCVRRG